MAFSGTVSTTVFNTNKVIDHAYRRCRVTAQRVTAELQGIATDALYLLLSELSSVKTPSWCIEKVILPFYEGQPNVTLPLGTVEVLNANYRYLQAVSGSNIVTATTYQVNFASTTVVSTVGIEWSAVSAPLSFSVSTDGITWTVVDTVTPTAVAGEITWFDIFPALAYAYFKITATSGVLSYTTITLGNTPNEIPFGALNRDSYVAQANQIFAGRPTTYWFQRDINQPVMHLWPAPNQAAELAQLIVWRHRHIMDVGTLQQELEIPQRWYEAIVSKLASKLAMETDAVDMNLIPMLDAKAEVALRAAWDGDNDGSPITITPAIGCYTR
jgi:predicted small secreted protein